MGARDDDELRRMRSRRFRRLSWLMASSTCALGTALWALHAGMRNYVIHVWGERFTRTCHTMKLQDAFCEHSFSMACALERGSRSH